MERRYRERAASYFDDILLDIRVVPEEESVRTLGDAESRGIISGRERTDLREADLVVRGRLWDGTTVHLLAEISATVDLEDVERASRRAKLLERIVGMRVIAAVAGERIRSEVRREASTQKVWCVVDRRAYPLFPILPLGEAQQQPERRGHVELQEVGLEEGHEQECRNR